MDPLEEDNTAVADLEERRKASIAAQAAGEDDQIPDAEKEQVELFPDGFIEGDGLTAGKLIKPGHSIEVTASIGKAEVPIREGGLIDPELKNGRVLISYEYLHDQRIPIWSSDREKVTGWKIRQNLRATHVSQANDSVKLITAEFQKMLLVDEPGAGKLLDDLRAIFSANNAG